MLPPGGGSNTVSGASCNTLEPGKSGLHARGEGERVMALYSREGTRASRRGRDWGQEEKGMTEDEMAGWHH